MNYSSKKKQILALLAAVLVTAVLLLSGLFIATHENHECIGDDCPVCAQMETCAAVIRLITEATGAGAVFLFTYTAVKESVNLYLAGLNLCPVSLVSLKIRLDD